MLLSREERRQDALSVHTLMPSEVTTDEQEATFLYSQILSEIFINIKYEKAEDVEVGLHETAAELRDLYAKNQSEIEKINLFERTYTSKTPVKWYTGDSAVYRVVNEALREQKTETLYNVRYYIKDLHRQLTQMHKQWKSSLSERQITLYRGTVWPESQFEKQLRSNIGGLLSFSSFTSTSLDRTLCDVIYGNCSGQLGKSGIVFEVKVDLDTCQWPCANITSESHYGDAEQEILFTMGTVFRIVSVEPKQEKGTFKFSLEPHCVFFPMLLYKTQSSDCRLFETERHFA
ncbi:unnamed protein product [Didymodactylos carnosus]|uniref:ADP ribosyltransferase domain-containing protein n=1 Tax=Didymodactylos carnosus TaxID=1234261 RepID=A0A815V6X6_9BILA|nr:unnamed protein product [Didymodactylos carnosus]CAF4385740.1 unnamed protein product [Didymodactylos carnosus]